MAIQERLSSLELERRLNIGVGLLIVNREGKIWTNVELKPKQDTARNVGDISIPTEQVKVGENLFGNVKGGLGEFCGDGDIPLLREKLFFVGSPKLVGVDADNWQVACNLVTVVCDIDINPTPAARDEVAPHGWMSIEEALRLSNLRSFSRQILEVAMKDNLHKKALNQTTGRFPILWGFGNGVSFDRFIQERDGLPDRFNSKSI